MWIGDWFVPRASFVKLKENHAKTRLSAAWCFLIVIISEGFHAGIAFRARSRLLSWSI